MEAQNTVVLSFSPGPDAKCARRSPSALNPLNASKPRCRNPKAFWIKVAEFEKKVAQTGSSIVGLDMGGVNADELEKKAREPLLKCPS